MKVLIWHYDGFFFEVNITLTIMKAFNDLR